MKANITRCRAANPAVCRVHGIQTGFDRKTGQFTAERPSLAEHKNKSDWFKFLITEDEQKAVRGYLDQDYMEITPLLYGAENFDSKAVQRQVKLIDKALNKYEVGNSEDKIVYRATQIKGGKFTNTEQVQEVIKQKYVVGETLHVEGYMSTTVNPQALFDFIPSGFHDMPAKKSLFGPQTFERYVELEGDHSLRGVVYEISTPSGAPVSTFGQTYGDKEQEYLLGRGKNFKIIEVIPYTKVVNPVQSHNRNQIHATVVRLVEIV